MTYEDAEPEILAIADKVAADLTARFEQARVSGSDDVYSKRLGFATPTLKLLGEDGGRHPTAPVKYAIDVRDHLAILKPLLPYFRDVKNVFEFGVGPGYLLRLLRDIYGMQIGGCDIELAELGVYKDLRAGLGLENDVTEYGIEYGKPLPIPEGTEAIIAFSTMFDSDWSIEQQRWFFDECARHLTGAKRVYWRANTHHRRPETREFFMSMGSAPIKDQRKIFRIIDLKDWHLGASQFV